MRLIGQVRVQINKIIGGQLLRFTQVLRFFPPVTSDRLGLRSIEACLPRTDAPNRPGHRWQAARRQKKSSLPIGQAVAYKQRKPSPHGEEAAFSGSLGQSNKSSE